MSTETVFVIGAGASVEVKLPDGQKLKEIISDKLNLGFEWREQTSGDPQITAALRYYCDVNNEDVQKYGEKACQASQALPLAISIDNFIDSHRNTKEIELCGKLAIVQSILEAEKESLLYFDNGRSDTDIDWDNLKNTWYLKFFHAITENCEFEQLQERFSLITLVIFNYDRCIEHFLVYAVKRYYDVSFEAARKIVSVVNILHPYGKVGRILSNNTRENVDFGCYVSKEKLVELAGTIRTFTESIDKENSYLDSLHEKISSAERIIFLGFGFHVQNMQILTLPKATQKGFAGFFQFPNCYASSFKIEDDGQNIIKRRIASLFDNELMGFENDQPKLDKIKIKNTKCKDFFEHYFMSLRF